MRKPIEQHRYVAQEQEGRKAKHGTLCPYGDAEVGKRCAWLAGHYDTHGLIAWQLASGRLADNQEMFGEE